MDFTALKPRNPETLKPWNPGTLAKPRANPTPLDLRSSVSLQDMDLENTRPQNMCPHAHTSYPALPYTLTLPCPASPPPLKQAQLERPLVNTQQAAQLERPLVSTQQAELERPPVSTQSSSCHPPPAQHGCSSSSSGTLEHGCSSSSRGSVCGLRCT